MSHFNRVHTRESKPGQVRVWVHAEHRAVGQLLGAQVITNHQFLSGRKLTATKERFGAHGSLTDFVCWLVKSHLPRQNRAANIMHNPLLTAVNCRLLPSCIRQDVFALQDEIYHTEQYQTSFSQQLRSDTSDEGVKYSTADREWQLFLFFLWSIKHWLVLWNTMIHPLGWGKILATDFFCLSRLLSQWHWIFGQNLFKWCFIREQENWKLKSCRAVSRSTWCTFTTSKYLHWPRSAWKPVSRFGNSLHPHPPPRLPPWAAWITLTSAHPSLRLYSLITCKQQDSKQEIILCSFLPFCNHLSSWVKLNP